MAAGYVSDVVGRKWAIILGLGLSYIGVTLEMVSTTNPVFFAGKFVNGLSGGLLVTVCVTYVGEVSLCQSFHLPC
jgi:MFS transporter, SP family, general alpha glucoside:H+ symporter